MSDEEQWRSISFQSSVLRESENKFSGDLIQNHNELWFSHLVPFSQPVENQKKKTTRVYIYIYKTNVLITKNKLWRPS